MAAVLRWMMRLLGLWLAMAPVHVNWAAPEDCASPSEVEAAIAERLDPAVESGISARVHVTLDAGVWSVDVVLQDPDGTIGTRRLEAHSCDDAVTAAAVVVALAVVQEQEDDAPPDVERVVVPSPPVPTPAVPERPAAPTQQRLRHETTAPRPRPEDGPRRPPGWAAHLGAGATALGLGPVSALLLGEVSAYGRQWLVFLGVAHRVQRQIRLDAGSAGPGAAFRLTAGRAGAGLRLKVGPVEVPIRVGSEWGALWAQGRGVAPQRTDRRLWIAAFASAAVGGRVSSRVALFAGAEVAAPLLRTPFTVDGGLELLTTGPVALRGFATVRVRLNASFSSNR